MEEYGMEVVETTQNSSKGFKMGRFAQWKWQVLLIKQEFRLRF